MHLPRPSRRRRAMWAAASLTTATALLTGPLPAATAADSPTSSAKVDSALRSAVRGGADATFFVVLQDQADLSRAGKKTSHAEAARTAYQELRATAEEGQRSLHSFLDRRTVGHRDYWIANVVQVTGDLQLVEVLGAHSPGETTAAEPVALHGLAWAVARRIQGRYEDGYEAARRALGPARRVRGTAGQLLLARSYATQAVNLGLAGRFGEAREAGDLALAPAQAYGDPTLLGSVLSTLRENARRHGRLHDAVGFGQRALDQAERSGDTTAAAFERSNLAELRLLLEEFEAARELAEAAVSGADLDGAWCLPFALTALARVRLRTGAEASAVEELLDRAEAHADRSGDQQARHETVRARAELALRTGRPAEALRVLDGAAVGAPDLTAWAELLSDRPGPACAVAGREADRAAGTGERLAEVEARLVHAAALSRLGEAESAARTLALATDLARALPYPAGLSRARQARRLFVQVPPLLVQVPPLRAPSVPGGGVATVHADRVDAADVAGPAASRTWTAPDIPAVQTHMPCSRTESACSCEATGDLILACAA
ncbi:hypothetical protein AB0E77_28795 [Streptomyces sp. NPDC032940]|uniref:hypothetical protein n=1 Tax=Streptomyces sp. NPDC032940 TaxID=3155366 RepID=UPI0033E8F9C0